MVTVIYFLFREDVFCSIKASCDLFCFVFVWYHDKTIFVLFVIGDEKLSEGSIPVTDQSSVKDESVRSTVIEF